MPAGGRVLLVFHEELLGGASVAMLRLLPLLEERGWQAVCWAPTGGELEAALRADGRGVVGLRRELRYSLASLRQPPGPLARLRSGGRYLRAFSQTARSGEFDLVHANSLLTLPEAGLARAAGLPVLLHVHEALQGGVKGRAAAVLARSSAHVVITVSAAARDALARRGVDARVVRNGVPAAEPVSRGDGVRRPVVGTVGTISRRKGTDLFVEMARRLGYRKADFRILGSPARGPEAPWATSLVVDARSAGIDVRSSADVAAELAGWDVFVLPSREDPFPLAVLEAMAAGLPVVATRSGGIVEQVTPETGVLVEAGDASALAAAVSELLDDPAARGSMGRAARERVTAEFGLDRQADALAAAYAEVVRRASA
ncbi:MAG TPA: glycosyltransferase family 4 protein [Thermoleophilaceae bacterium]